MIWVKLIQDVLFFAVIIAFVFYLGMVYGMAAAHKTRRKEVENTGHLLLGWTLYKAEPVEKERERANNREILKRMKRGKYGNLKFNGFDSKKEAQFAADLERLKAAETAVIEIRMQKLDSK